MRRAFALLTAATTSLVVIASVVPLGLLVDRQAESSALTRAELVTQSIGSELARRLDASTALQTATVAQAVLAAYDGPGWLSVVLPDDTTFGSPTDITPVVQTARAGRAVTSIVDGGAEVVAPVVTADGTVVVRLMLPADALDVGVRRAWIVLVLLGATLVAVAVFAADRLGRGVIGPTQHLAETANKLGSGELTARADVGGPREIAQVGQALNRLGARVQDLVEAERELVADLSHRLRTPLAALRLEIEADPDHDPRVFDHLDRVDEAVTDLIKAARQGSDRPRVEETNLSELLRDRMIFWQVMADEQERRFQIEIEDDLRVPLTPEEAAAAVDVVLGNVFAHTPAGTAFTVTLERSSQTGVVFRVRDHGPGVDGPEVLERGASGADSSGLGLDIARQAATRAGGTIDVSNAAGRGTVVTLTFAG